MSIDIFAVDVKGECIGHHPLFKRWLWGCGFNLTALLLEIDSRDTARLFVDAALVQYADDVSVQHLVDWLKGFDGVDGVCFVIK